MSRPRRAEVVETFHTYVARELARFTREPIFLRRPRDGPGYFLTFRQPARLQNDLYLVVHHYFTVEETRPETAGYHYAFETAEGKEIIVYHWHPLTVPPDPHLHLKSGALVGRQDLARAHIPTGDITWSELLWLMSQLTAGS